MEASVECPSVNKPISENPESCHDEGPVGSRRKVGYSSSPSRPSLLASSLLHPFHPQKEYDRCMLLDFLAGSLSLPVLYRTFPIRCISRTQSLYSPCRVVIFVTIKFRPLHHPIAYVTVYFCTFSVRYCPYYSSHLDLRFGSSWCSSFT